MRQIGCLVIHGFAGDVHEVITLATALKDQGYIVECPTLEGHGLGRKHLGKSSREKWVRSAHEAYKRLAMRTDEIVVIGFSMGGLLGVHLASSYPIKQLVTINTPYYYWDIGQAWRNLREDTRGHFRRYLNSLVKIPVPSMLQFRRLLAETKQLLPKVNCPYLILQGLKDDTVKSVSAEHLRQHVDSDQVEIVYFPESGHLLLKGSEAKEAIRLIQEQIASHRD
ncbi:alpha/beta hydrolase [Brevibacillus ginsengisoli]|uniref:alpha/beta hydrolase n=1 Tax=Brevibacillus ginsengisoli TaxID=363854 RepID=UPI003CE698ED